MTTPLPVLPQIIVEAGLVTASPVQPGSALILDDATLGKLDTGTLGADFTWSDLSPRVLGFTITRPSTRVQGPLWQYQAGTASILMDNSDGALDPDNSGSPFWAAGQTELVPMVPVRVRAVFSGVTYGLYWGHADGWLPAQVTYEGGYAELSLPVTDGFKVLAGIMLPAAGAAGAGETTGARITRILNAAGWYTGSAYRTVAAGKSTVQAYAGGDTALNLMQATADSEIGQLYLDGSGKVVFRDRQQILTDTRSNTPQAVFGDLPGTVQAAGTELAYAAIGRANDDTTLANDIQATYANGGALQEVQDAGSIARYLFPRSYQRTDLILQDNPTTMLWAQWVLYISKGGEDRIESLAVDPQADTANLWPQVLSREIGDRIQVWHRPASVASPIVKDCFVAGITHVWDSVASSWLTTWNLQDASKYGSFLVLDNPTLGKLDGNALAFLPRVRVRQLGFKLADAGLQRRQLHDDPVPRLTRQAVGHRHVKRHAGPDDCQRRFRLVAVTRPRERPAAGRVLICMLAQQRQVRIRDISHFRSIRENAALASLGAALAVKVWNVGDVLTAADMNAWAVPLAAYKTGNESVTSSAVLQNDDHLFFSVAANAVYLVELVLSYQANAASDIQIAFTAPAGATHVNTMLHCLTTTAAAGTDDAIAAATSNPGAGGIGSGTQVALLWKSTLTTAGTAGTLQLQWAQLVSGGTATTCLAGSHLIAQRVG